MEFVRTSAAGYEKVPDSLDYALLNVSNFVLLRNIIDHAMPMATFGNNPTYRSKCTNFTEIFFIQNNAHFTTH